MNMGPQHPSAHGVFRAILTLEGETVVGVDAVIGYLHRCHEKLAETLAYVQYPTIASKTDYVAAMSSELAYVMAAERIGQFEVPKRAQYLRVLVGELQRIASHCLWLGTWCMDMGGALGGGATIFLYCIRERELVLDLFESLVGARLLYGFHQVGGVRYDMPAGWAAQCRTTVDLIEQRLRRVRVDARGQPVLHDADEGRRRRSRPRWRWTSAISGPLLRGLGRELRPAARAAVLVVRGLRLPRPGRDRRRLPRALPGADGRVPRVDPDRPADPRRPAGGADLVAARREVAGAGEGAEGRGLRARRRPARGSRLLPRRRRQQQAVPHEVARRVVLEPGGAAAHPARLAASPTSSRSWDRSIRCSARWTDELGAAAGRRAR